jgi:phosphatidylserine/phosphatidylglycerophosphate/cardiolipin synthase-like enzyme
MNGKLLLILSFLILIILFAGCTSKNENVVPPHLVTTPSVNVGVTPTAVSSFHTLIVEPDDGKSDVISAINGAKSNVTLTIYELTDSDIVTAIVNAKQRGVDVRVIYNSASFGKDNPNTKLILILNNTGIKTKPASPTFEVTHQKTLVVDNSEAIIMTFNLEPEYFKTTRDFAVVTTNPDEIQEIETVFNADWNYQKVTPSYDSLVWSPTNSRDKITGVINGATKTLDVYNEEITDSDIVTALLNAEKRGVNVRIIAADLESGGRNENTPALKQMSDSGVQTKVITSLYIHAKVIVADDNIAYVGSENFGKVSLDRNRELGIIVSDRLILDKLEETFNHDWNGL